MTDSLKELLTIIEKELERKGMSAASASKEAVGNFGLIKNMREGASPRYSSLQKLCEVLDLEFYIGPPRVAQIITAPVLGAVSARVGDKVSVLDDYDPNIEYPVQVPSPEAGLVAFQVSEHLSRAIKGLQYIYIHPRILETPADYINSLCLVDHEGELKVKILRRGADDKHWNLECADNSPTIEDYAPPRIHKILYTKC